MITRILLPTDGSAPAERAISLAERIAACHGANVTVVRVVPPITWLGYDPATYGTTDMYQGMFDAVDDDARRYLARVAERLSVSGVSVTTELVHGAPGAMLLDLEEKLAPDLVVMGTHGRTGLARFALGSIADLMVREGATPVLLVRAFAPALSALHTALVPLDGSPLAEEALPMVEALARKPIESVRLLHAIEMEVDRAPAQRYLEGVATRLGAAGLDVSTELAVGPAAQAIGNAARHTDLVVLSTHGRGGFDRLRHGSVATEAIRDLGTPTLLVRARPAQAPVIQASDTAALLA